MAFPTQSADFESGSSQYLAATDSASLSITQGTFEAWVKFESLPGSGSDNVIMSKWDSAGSARNWMLTLDNNNQCAAGSNLCVRIDSDGSNTFPTGGYYSWTPSTGVWYHVAATFTSGSPGTVAIYVDGVSQTVTYSIQSATTIGDNGQDTRIGARNATAAGFFDGRIVEARVWSTVRTGSELLAARCTNLGVTTGLSAEWTLDNTLNDNSGNSNTLTNVNSVTFGFDVPSTCASGAPLNLLTLGVG